MVAKGMMQVVVTIAFEGPEETLYDDFQGKGPFDDPSVNNAAGLGDWVHLVISNGLYEDGPQGWKIIKTLAVKA